VRTLRNTVTVLVPSFAFALFGCGGGSPSAPTPPPVAGIGLSGNLAFGDVLVGSAWSSTLTINNNGNAPLSVTGMTGPSGFSSSWTSGSIAPGGTQAVTIGFEPTASGVYGGTITVSANHSSGTNTMGVSGTAYPDLNGAWSGTNAVSAASTSAICNMTWIVSGQTGPSFSGTWQTSGARCGQAGTLTGTVSPTNAISGLNLSATVAPSLCSRVGGDGLLSGAVSNNALTAQVTETIRCPGLPDTARSITLSVRK
jgi:hypothetical protein